jgi:hypothetical protein
VISNVFETAMTEIDVSSIGRRNDSEFVYVLLFDGSVIYVGRTKDLSQRLGFHKLGTSQHEPKRFNRAFFLELPIVDASACEGALIRRFDPVLVNGAPGDQSRDQEMLARLGLDYDRESADRFTARRSAVFIEAHRRARVRQWASRGWRRVSLSSVLWKAAVRHLKKAAA